MKRNGKARLTLTLSSGVLEGTADGRFWRMRKPIDSGAPFIPGRYIVSAPVERRFFGLVSVLSLADSKSAPLHIVSQFHRERQCQFPDTVWVEFMTALAADEGGELLVV
jgi:hypothetical protein